MRRRFGIGFGHGVHTFGWRPFYRFEPSEDFTVFLGWWQK